MKKNVQNKNYRRGWRLLAVIGMLLCLPLLQLKAQEMRTITGLVVDQKGEILPGATVKAVQAPGVKTLIATSTDLDGKFKLNIPSEVTQIEVTFVGYKNQQVALKGKTDFKIVLTEDTQEMEEVVVTGMFTRKANSYTGSVTTIKGDELKTVGNGNVLSSLKNIDPSFLMVENLEVGSNPNAIPDFQMRGQTGFTEVASEYQENPNQPLFILDGFETTLTKIMDLDMNQVQSVTLLKDATAKAIYGSKAANGVVVVETIRPEKGKMKITYTGSLDIEAPDLSSYDLCNAEEKLRAEYLAGFYTSSTGSATEQMNLDKRYTTVASAIAAGVDTYWLDKPLRVGVGQKHSLYLEGGDDYMLYGIDLSYNNVAGVMKGSNRNTLSGGITFSYKYKNLLFRNKFTIDDNKSNDSPYGSFSDYAYLNPYNRLHDEDGEMEDSWTGLVTEYNYLKNGLINTRFEDRYTTFTENFYASAAANKNILKKISNSLKALNDSTDEEYDSSSATSVPVRYEEGQSMSTIWVVKSLGIDPQTGKEVFVKKDGSLTYDWSSSDFIAGGDTRPKVSGNFGINMEYHGFGLNAGFTWRLGGQMYNTTLLDKVENADVHYNVDRRVFTGRWSEPGQVARFKSITDDSETKPTSRFVEDYNLLTFSSLNVYYDFRECRFMEKSFLQRMKATFYMNDIATISSVKTERGTSYPFARSFSFSLQVTF